MSGITDIIQQYSEGQVDWPTVRETLRQIPFKNPAVSESIWIADDNLDIDGMPGEIAACAFIYDLTVDEYVQACDSFYGQVMGKTATEPEASPEGSEDGGESLGLDEATPAPDAPVEKGTIAIVKRDDRRNLVFGWANVAFTPDGQQVEDHQGHLIDLEDLESAAYDYVVKYRLTGDMHQGEAFGELVESMVVTEDKVEKAGFPRSMLGHWWVGFKVPPENWDAVQKGDRVMFSIQGKARLEPFEDS